MNRIYLKAGDLIRENIPFCLVTAISGSGRFNSLIGIKGLAEENATGQVELQIISNGGAVSNRVQGEGRANEVVKQIFARLAQELAQECLINQQLMLKTVLVEEEEITLFVEPIATDPELIILGAGHIARPLAKMAKMLDYQITVYDDRPDFANTKFFTAGERIICDSFDKISSHDIVKQNSIVVVVTRGHQHDLTCLDQLIGKKLTYLGMIGSRRRSLEVRQLLLRQGFSQEGVDFLHAPIGLDIGADTPEEIAISILAEITKERRKGWKKGNLLALDKKTFVGSIDRGAYQVLKLLAEKARNNEQDPMALATIVKTMGSTPRKAGAKMIINGIGQTFGTIGGGCGEAEVKVTALDVISSSEPALVRVNMNNDVAGDEGMVCGGAMEVFIEPL
ncbi:MAG: XdhC family protein [Clostridia bacterium]|nr:XdhC family protein [Clostridia bacterium]